MKRTQIYIDDETYGQLQRESSNKGVSISEIIRESIRRRTGNRVQKMLKAAHDIAGVWKDRNVDVEAYVREKRKDRKS